MPSRDVRLITYDPGHFHAALVQKEMYQGVSPCVHVYAPLGSDLLAHLERIAGFNSREQHPTSWELEVHTCADPLARLASERRGNVVVLSGRNRSKIDSLLASLKSGLNVLADKPWVIRVEDLPKLKAALDLAEARGLVALDIMTERHEITNLLQRELIHDPEIFGVIDPGSPERPSVFMESEHFLCKTVAGAPNRRPAWFFDVEQAGEGLSDVGTHLVDLVPWILFPNDPISPDEIEITKASRVPTMLSRNDFQKATGEPDYPGFLAPYVVSSQLLYYCNTMVSYRLRGIHVWMNVSWNFEARPGIGDRLLSRFRGNRSSIEIRQGEPEQFRPEVYLVPEDCYLRQLEAAVRNRLEQLRPSYPGVGVEEVNGKLRLVIPEPLRIGHEAHFARVMRQFLGYLDDPATLPSWEKSNMLAKYHVTTHGVALAREDQPVKRSVKSG
jgi:predicted dehydrogenase